MKLIRFELRKVFSGNIKYFALLLILLNAAVFYVGMIPRIPSAEQVEYEKIWREKAGEQGGSIEEKRQYLEEQTADYGLLMTYLGAPDVMTEEEKKAVTERFRDTDYLEMEPEELYAESAALGQIMTEYASAAEYGSFVDEMESRAEAMLGVPIFENSRFSAANIRKTVEDFADVKELEVTPADGRYLEPMQNFYLTDILCIVMICLFCFRLFGFDHDSGMGNLIHTAPAGRTALRFAQLTAVWLTAALSAALLYGGNLLQTAVLTGAENLGAYVQGIAAFQNVAFPCTVGTYLLLYLAGKILAALLSASVCQFFCVKFGGGKTAWLFFAGVTAASFFLWFLVPDSPAVKLFRYLNPVGIFDMKQILGNYQNLNLFSVPFSLLSAAVIFTLVLGALYGAAVWCPVYAEYFIRYGIADGAYSIRSVPELAHAAFDLPIAAYMVLTVAMRVLIGAYLGILIGFLAQILQQPAQNIFAGILLLILPLCLSYVGGMGYENPLVNLIKNELAFATAHVQILSGFQRSCVGFGPAEWGIFLLIPAVMLYIGKKKWDQGGALNGFCPVKCPLKWAFSRKSRDFSGKNS